MGLGEELRGELEVRLCMGGEGGLGEVLLAGNAPLKLGEDFGQYTVV